jgi:Ser/Thr protein kinase RdoA (MazF antagonist)
LALDLSGNCKNHGVYGSLEGIGSHLEERHGIVVAKISPLEPWAPNAVQRVDRGDGAPWTLRVFSPERPIDLVEAEAAMLRYLAENDFPAEKCATEEPVSILNDQAVFVTEFVEGTNCRGDNDRATLRGLGELLGRLHSLPAFGPAAGSWHLMTVDGGPRTRDAATILSSLDTGSADALRPFIDDIEDRHDLPQAVLHPDFCGPNIIRSSDGRLVVIDWTGSGRGARISTLGLLLRAGEDDVSLVDPIVEGYGIELSSDEVDRLPAAIREHGIVMGSWMLMHGRQTVDDVVRALDEERRAAENIQMRVAALMGS